MAAGSSAGLATICMPVGTPHPPKPDGTDKTGWFESMLKGRVITHPRYGSTSLSLIRSEEAVWSKSELEMIPSCLAAASASSHQSVVHLANGKPSNIAEGSFVEADFGARPFDLIFDHRGNVERCTRWKGETESRITRSIRADLDGQADRQARQNRRVSVTPRVMPGSCSGRMSGECLPAGQSLTNAPEVHATVRCRVRVALLACCQKVKCPHSVQSPE